MKRTTLILIVPVAIVGVISWRVFENKKTINPSTLTSSQQSKNQASSSHSFNKMQYSTSDPNSIWVIVNKQHPLNPINYIPSDLVVPTIPLRAPGNESMKLRQATAIVLEQMFAAAKQQGINLMLASGYRSYSYQTSLYGGYVKNLGRAGADMQSARPGYSEHQSGFAADLEPLSRKCELQQCFETTPEGQWLVANSYKYGFIIRYTKDKVSFTGYEYEPWHVRYIGESLAMQMHNEGVSTLEEFFNVTGGSSY